MESYDHISVVEALSCMGDLPLQLLSELIQRLQSSRVAAQMAVYEQGDSAELVYFVGSGRLAKYEQGEYAGLVVRGQMAGWDSFYHQCPRDHSLIAQNDCTVYALKRTDFAELAQQVPSILLGFLAASTPVPYYPNAKARTPLSRQIAVVMFEDLSALSEMLTRQLMHYFASSKDAVSFGCDAFSKLAGIGVSHDQLFGHLASDVFAHLESDNETVVYFAKAGDPRPWYEKLIYQVDTLVIAVKDGTAEIPIWFEALLKASSKKPGLLIVKEEPGSFGQASRALWTVFEPQWHYRIHLQDTRRWASVARMAQGQAINLVLSGGGCLGAIHCGILQSLNDIGFPVDSIGGTSAGSGLAMSYAMGDSTEEIARKFRYAFTEQKPFNAYTLPLYGLLNPKKLDKLLQLVSAGRWLEESTIPVHATVTNLTLSRAETLTTGPMWEAMRMSGSLPGILPPFIRDGFSYIDGGVLNNFPVSVAQQRYGGTIVGVTFKLTSDTRVNCCYEDRPDSIQALLTKLKMRKKVDYPSLGSVLTNSLMLGNSVVYKEAINSVDILLRPPVPANIGLTSFDRFDELYEIGVEYGAKFFADWSASDSVQNWAVARS